jgi:SLAP domain-containing protein
MVVYTKVKYGIMIPHILKEGMKTMNSSEFKISYAPKDENNISKLSRQLDIEDLKDIGDIKENSVSFKTVYIFEVEDAIEIKVFITNSTKSNINFKYLPLKIVNKENEIVASEYLNLVDVGEIPPMNIRPCSVFLSKDSIVTGKTIDDECQLMVKGQETSAKLSNKTVIDAFYGDISLYEKRIIEKYVENMPPLIKNDYKIHSYKNSIDENGNKFSILIFSNGLSKDVYPRGFTMMYKDQGGLIKASKEVKNLPLVKANSTIVVKIVLEKEDILKERFNPEQCKLTLSIHKKEVMDNKKVDNKKEVIKKKKVFKEKKLVKKKEDIKKKQVVKRKQVVKKKEVN